MNRKTADKANKILREDVKKSVDAVKDIDPIEETKIKSLDFYRRSLDKIDQERKLKEAVGEKILEKVSDPEENLTVSQLAGLYEMLGRDTTASTEVLLSIVKPAPNTDNPIMKRPTAEQYEQNSAFNEASSKDLQNMQLLQEHMMQLLAMQNQAIGVSSSTEKDEEG